MANLTFQQVRSTSARVKTFNVSGTLWDTDVELIKFSRKKFPNLTDLEIFIRLWHDDRVKFVLPDWQIIFWATMFALIVLASVLGNLVVMWTVASNKKMKSITSCFLVSAQSRLK